MAIRDVLVYTDNDGNCQSRVLCAAKICHHFGAHLTGLYALRMLAVHPYPYTYLPPGVFETLEAQAKTKSDDAKEKFNADINGKDISSEFCPIHGDVIEPITHQTRYADMLVVPQQHSSNSELNPRYQVSSILLEAACPILVLPENYSQTLLPIQRALIAWDGSHECARALNFALPMLTQVESVDVLSVSTSDKQATNISRHIARHGIKTNIHLVDDGNSNVGSTLLDQATSLNSQLIVMGAYGHSRLREEILGGTTKYMLEHAHLPILYSH